MQPTTQVTRTIPATPDAIWETLTSKAGMKAYMMGADVETDWQVGHPITMRGEYGGKPFEDSGEVRSFEPARKLAYTHRSGGAAGPENLVTFELSPKGEGTEVTVTQANTDAQAAPAKPEQKAQYEKTWTAMLESLERAVGR